MLINFHFNKCSHSPQVLFGFFLLVAMGYDFLRINSQSGREEAFLWFLECIVKFLPRGVYAGASQLDEDMCFTTTSPALGITVLMCVEGDAILLARFTHNITHYANSMLRNSSKGKEHIEFTKMKFTF